MANPLNDTEDKGDPSLVIFGNSEIEKNLPTFVKELRDAEIKWEKELGDAKFLWIPPHSKIYTFTAQNLETEIKNLSKISQIDQKIQDSTIICAVNWKNWGIRKRNLITQSVIEKSSLLSLIPVRDCKELIQVIKSVAKREQIADDPPIITRIKSRTKFLADAQEELVKGLRLCGKTKTRKLLSHFDTPLNIFEAILHTPEEVKKIPGFGEEFIAQNQQLLKDVLNLDSFLNKDQSCVNKNHHKEEIVDEK